jgi:Tol biopolymer transport system component
VLTSGATESSYPDMTPDGKWIVFNLRRPGGRQEWELRLRTLSEPGDRTLLVTDTDRGEERLKPHISSDGRKVVFRYIPPESLRRGRSGGTWGVQQLRMLDLDTKQESELTKATIGLVAPNGWSRDGRVVVTLERRRHQPGAKGMALGLLPVAAAPDAESQMTIITTSVGNLYQPSMSPDRRWLAFRVPASTDARQIAVVESKDGLWAEPRDERSWSYLDPDGAPARDKPRWSPNGRLLYYVSDLGGLKNVWAVDFDPMDGVFGKPFQLTSFNGPGDQIPDRLNEFEIAVGGGRLVMPTLRPTGGIWLLPPPQNQSDR